MHMDRPRLDHILRSARKVTGLERFVLIGSAAVLAWREMVPPEMVMSREADLFPFEVDNAEQVSDELDGVLGQGSMFDETFGYYCDGVSEQTAILPTDWLKRSMEYASPSTEGTIAVVPSPDDIALAKLCAWREKDREWLIVANSHGIISLPRMKSLLPMMPDRAPAMAELKRRIMDLGGQFRHY